VTPRKREGLPDWRVIARRELIERVRTWWFVAVTLLGPIVMIGAIVVPAVLAAKAGTESVRVVIVDHDHAGIAELLQQGLEGQGWKAELAPADAPEDALRGRIADDEIDGFLTIPEGAAAVGASPRVVYQGDNATSQQVVITLQAALVSAVYITRFMRDYQIPPDVLAKEMAAPVLGPRHTTGEVAEASGAAVFLVGYAVMFVLYLAIVLYAVNVMRSVVMEKTNRVVEIMVAAAKPRALMSGKILGVGAAGLIQIAAWAGMAFITITFRGEILGLFGVEGAGNVKLPPLGIDAVVVILAYFLLGYFFYAALYAAIGAMVSSEQEAQQAQTPVILLLIVPMMCMQIVANDPRGSGAQMLTTLPFSAPILMPMRYVLDGATGPQVALSLGILALSTWLAAWVAARIYRVGILMYGKRPSLRELARWIRHK